MTFTAILMFIFIFMRLAFWRCSKFSSKECLHFDLSLISLVQNQIWLPKFWLPKLVTCGHRLPNLIANISSQFHYLVNTGLAVGCLVKWLPIKVINPSKIDKFEQFIARRLKMASSDCNHLQHTMPCEIWHPMVWDTSVNSLVLILKKINVFLPCKLIFWKSYQSW